MSLPGAPSTSGKVTLSWVCLSLRPMQYPGFSLYKSAINNLGRSTRWISPATSTTFARARPPSGTDRAAVAFFATATASSRTTGLNCTSTQRAEARMYLSRRCTEALHVQFYLTLLDTYIPDPDSRSRPSRHREIPSIRKKGVLLQWIDTIQR